MKLRECESIPVLGIFLGVIALFSALVLAVVSDLTAEPIAQAARANENKALRQLNLPEFDNSPSQESVTVKSPGGLDVVFMKAKKNGVPVGFIAKTTWPGGYSGPIDLLCGLDGNGVFTAVLITRQSETPGLGSDVCERKFRKNIFNLTRPTPAGLAPNLILDQYTGKRAEKKEWRVTKDGGEFAFKTGATVTSRAVTQAVSEVGASFVAHRDNLFKGEKK